MSPKMNIFCQIYNNQIFYFHGLHILISGIQIRRYEFSEAQDGKSHYDAKNAHLRHYVA